MRQVIISLYNLFLFLMHKRCPHLFSKDSSFPASRAGRGGHSCRSLRGSKGRRSAGDRKQGCIVSLSSLGICVLGMGSLDGEWSMTPRSCRAIRQRRWTLQFSAHAISGHFTGYHDGASSSTSTSRSISTAISTSTSHAMIMPVPMNSGTSLVDDTLDRKWMRELQLMFAAYVSTQPCLTVSLFVAAFGPQFGAHI